VTAHASRTGSDGEEDADLALDDVDRQILAALLADGRASASDLSAVAGVATATATKRRQRLEDAGVIEGYRPVVDFAALGYDVTAVFRLDVVGDGIPPVLADLRATGRMVGVYEVTGDADVVAVGKFADTAELDAQIKTLLTHPEVRGVNTNIVLDIVTEDAPLPVADAESG